MILPNPARRFRWLCGGTPEAIGIRVPELPVDARNAVGLVGVVASTSANLHGGPEPRTIGDVPEELVAGVSAVLDGGELPGTPSTVLDLTNAGAPQVLREGAGSAADALARLRAR